jgi:CHAT domain-containing protein/Tfp pilus assembly protein PilF
MPSSRNLRRAGLGLAGVLGIAILTLWFARAKMPVPVQEAQNVTETTIKILGPPRTLVPGKPIEEEIKGGEGHPYELELKAGEYVHVVVEQKEIDLVLQRVDGDGELLRSVDSPHGAWGPENLFAIADTGGKLRLVVGCETAGAQPGSYEIRIVRQREAAGEDRRRLAAWERFLQAEDLRRQWSSQEAIAIYRETLPVWRELGETAWEAESLFLIGMVSHDTGDFDPALAAFEEVLPLLSRLGRKDLEGIVLNRKGAILLRRGQREEAWRSHEEALVLFRDIGRPDLEASALNNQGVLLSDQGEPEKAQEKHQQALERARASGALHEESLALHGMASILTFQGKLEAAYDTYQRAVQIEEQLPGREADQAETLTSLADVSQRIGRLDDALAQLEHALALKRQTGDLSGEIVTLSTLGTLHLRRDEPERAREAFERTLKLSRERKYRSAEGFSLLNLGRYYYHVKNFRKAFEAHEQSAAVFQSIGHRRGQASTLYGSARALHELGDFTGALERLNRVLPDVESLRSESEGPDTRSSYFATKQHYLELHIDVLMHLDEAHPNAEHDTQAIEINERRLARSLLDLLGESRAKIRQDADPQLIAREKALQQEIGTTEKTLLQAKQAGEQDRIKQLETLQRSLLDELDTLRGRLRKENPRYAALVHPEPLTVRQMQWMLDEQTLLLVFSLGEERSFLWCIPHEGRVVSQVLASRSEIEDLARNTWTGWSRRGTEANKDAERRALRLSQMLLGKISDRLRVRRLVIVADGALQGIPFAALPQPVQVGKNGAREPLAARHEVVYLPSMSALAALRHEAADRVEAPLALAVVADPVFGRDDPRLEGKAASPETARPAGSGDLERAARDLGIDRFSRLPYTEDEAEAISSLVTGDDRKKLALGFDASLETVRSGVLQNYRYLHFATHGLLNAKHPDLSGLVLSLYDREGRPQEGFLFGHEIYNLELPAELVVLSACETGRGAEVRGEGIVGLSRGFMYAGAPRVMVSLWKVSDEGTAELMKRFYRAVFQHHLPPAQALRCAQLSLQQNPRWSPPFYWAPFIFLGEWNREVSTGPPSDDSIETQVGGTKVNPSPPDDLPPPSAPPPCPRLD